jgi:hypothetical protein
MPPTLKQIRDELAEQARRAEEHPMPAGLTEQEQEAWLLRQIETRRREMGIDNHRPQASKT